MAVSPLNELNKVLATQAGNIGTGSARTADSKNTDSFQSLMETAGNSRAATAYASNKNQMSSDSKIQQLAQSKKNNDAKSASSDTAKASASSSANSANSAKKADTANNAQNSKSADSSAKTDKTSSSQKDAAKDAASEAENAIVEETAKKLGISEEDLLSIMEQLGLTAADLLAPENVSLVVANVLGDGDIASIVTDESMLSMVKDINQEIAGIVQEISADAGIDADALKEALAGLSEKASAGENIEKIETLPKMDQAADQTVEAIDEPAAESSSAEGIANVQNAEENNSSETGKDSGEDSAGKQDHSETASTEHIVVSTEVVDGGTEIVFEEEIPLPQSSSAEDILNQMTTQIRSRVTPEVSQLQMQLNPENLGTVGLTISMKEGHMTAQFTTQNEDVRAAIESQVAVLKENLEQQGVKIEAVEVTVGSHAFERNLEQGNDENRQQEEEQERLRKATRKIDLGAYGADASEEELAEEELVTVEMMQADGNRMDYKV